MLALDTRRVGLELLLTTFDKCKWTGLAPALFSSGVGT
jgi:hypothetical protein